MAAQAGVSLAQAAYRFILSNPAVTTALGGFSSIAQMEEICAVSDMPPLTPADLGRLNAIWAGFPA